MRPFHDLHTAVSRRIIPEESKLTYPSAFIFEIFLSAFDRIGDTLSGCNLSVTRLLFAGFEEHLASYAVVSKVTIAKQEGIGHSEEIIKQMMDRSNSLVASCWHQCRCFLVIRLLQQLNSTPLLRRTLTTRTRR